MAEGHQVDSSWMWHPSFSEERKDTAGLFVHFRRTIDIKTHSDIPQSLRVHITADTRYKLYVNRSLVAFGPVKGDAALWFYDEVDLAPHLVVGRNLIAVVVLRFFHSTQYATSFPRLSVGGLRIVVLDHHHPNPKGLSEHIGSSTLWETAIDPSAILRVDEPEDDFLHVYEDFGRPRNQQSWTWHPAQLHEFQTSTGNAPPWRLSPRLIPPMERNKELFKAVHNAQSSISKARWNSALLTPGSDTALRLPAGSKHQFDLEMSHHTTGFLEFLFDSPEVDGGLLQIIYSESYEDEPKLVPYLRRKGDRLDTRKSLIGPSDLYRFQGLLTSESNARSTWTQQEGKETYSPFHFRTFRFLRVSIDVGPSDLVFNGVNVESLTYPLDIKAALVSSDQQDSDLWETSIRTLRNCMHDCYEDCPFYEQLQYAMDTRSSILFTYRISGDDRMARQAIIQLHNSFQPHIGLTSSRAPSHKWQIIPNFSLFWICTLNDHLENVGDLPFLLRFAPTIDSVLGYFKELIGPLGLIKSDFSPGIWNFSDWATEWRPYGIPPSVERTGISTYTNHLYAYTLRKAADVVAALGRTETALEYLQRADDTVRALRKHCFDGELFADTVACEADRSRDYSQQCQAWAVLSGAACGKAAQNLLRKSLRPQTAMMVSASSSPSPSSRRNLVPASIAMSFYTLRALSLAGGSIYDECFHDFWDPWRAQLALNVTTWEEDDVSQRSDCHAWGCAPLYEFMAEVAGISPAKPGWAAIRFRPRLGLYDNFKARCPFRVPPTGDVGVAHVEWATDEVGNMEVRLSFELDHPRIIPVLIQVPGMESRVTDTMNEISFWVTSSERGSKFCASLRNGKKRRLGELS